jgi:hypothetical protein
MPMMSGMTSQEIRELLELSERLHRGTRRACERSRAACDSVLSALSAFNRDVGLTEADLETARRHRAGAFTAPRLRDLGPL